VGHGRADGPEFSAERQIWFAPATATLYRRALFEKAGLLDETFESYLEDIDFGVRCAALQCAGRYAPRAVAYHVGSAALGKWHPDVVRRIARNQVFLVAKYYPSKLLVRLAWPIFVSQALWGFVALRNGAFGAYVRGKLEGLRLFRNVRKTAAASRIEAQALAHILDDAEREISRMQRRIGFDWYWRVYFALTAGGAD
jgi:GT2 family glycosyltransferase